MPSQSSEKAIPGIRLNRLVIDNFKAIGHLELDFPEPRMADEPDVMVIGSKNGVGKTSILEACALLYLTLYEGTTFSLGHFPDDSSLSINISDYIIRAGTSGTKISGFFSIDNNKDFEYWVELNTEGFRSNFHGDDIDSYNIKKLFVREGSVNYDIDKMFHSLFGFGNEIFVLDKLMYFNSYRKIKEGAVKINSKDEPVSFFKNEIVNTMMDKSGIVEGANIPEAENHFNVCNELIKNYSSHKLDKLRNLQGSRYDIRLSRSEKEPTISFDGLSSGQKEIISTLFLIWKHTKDNPGIVLIDEPELHLNADWHSELIYQLFNLVPQNQYIIATHSEDVFASVEKDRRIIISAD